MKSLLKVALAVVCGLAPLHAGFVLNFDEIGNGTISIDQGPFQTFNGSLIADPSSTLGNVMAWKFSPFNITFREGDVLIADPSGAVSDALRFTDASGSLVGLTTGNIMIFYSSDVSAGLPADTGFPSNLNGSIVATEDPADYFTYDASPNVYNGYSGVPEPASVAMLGLGLAALLATKFKSKSRPVS
jgi:hypothetical protein